ncbi:MAG TPA: flagellar biosynthetic protein FliO [Bryobacteraceae bacterium]|nr:flagellar biosynthetic protein FliO [Bryobacteraceae bacterium]
MDIVQQVLAVCVVLGLLLAFLWWMRRGAGLRVTGWARKNAAVRSLESVERLTLTPHHALHLIRLHDRHFLIGVHASGLTLLERIPAGQGKNSCREEGL